MDILPVFVSRKSKLVPNPGDPKCISYKLAQYMPKKVPLAVNQKGTAQVKIHFTCRSKLNHKQADLQKIPRPIHLITNLVYRLKPHHTRNLYLRARLDTCADVNLMPASVYKLVFQDPNLEKLAPSSLEMGTYTTDTIKVVVPVCFT